MLHAAAMLVGLLVIYLLATPHVNMSQDMAMAAGAALVCVVVTARLGGVAPNAFARAPQLLMLVGARARSVLTGALATMRAAIAADVTLKPALVRVRTRAAEPFTRAALADMISAAPGAVVVDANADGLLVHVTNEDAVDAADLGRLEARVLRALEPGMRS